jgi:hypothetical protein
MTVEPLSLMEFVHELVADAGLRAQFAGDPRTTLHAYGLGDLSPADVHDALVLVQDNEITDFRPAGPSWDSGADLGFGSGSGGDLGPDPTDHTGWDVPEPAFSGWGPVDEPVGEAVHENLWDLGAFGGGSSSPEPDAPGPDLHDHS